MIVAFQLIAGVVLLWFGAEFLVRGASRLAIGLGIAPLVVGLTVVASATSAPELMVSVLSAWRGEADICLGNVVGSNLFNLLCILGLTAAICPIPVQAAFVTRETPIMIAASMLLLLLCRDGAVSRPDAAILMTGIVVYLWFIQWIARREKQAVASEFDAALSRGGRAGVNLLLILIGLVMLLGGSHFLVEGAKVIARSAGMSDAVIGLTIVAAGTSLPELATSIMAARRKQPDIALGNIVGSNVFNVLAIVGAAGLIRPLSVDSHLLQVDIPLMIVASLAAWPIVLTGKRISRFEGLLLFSAYVVYNAYLVVRTTNGGA